jgi:DNA-binding transcriptional LysR family regulator
MLSIFCIDFVYKGQGVDLSLTRVFCAIYEAGSVSKAADGLCVTQPTVSHALKRLRVELADPLFVRTPAGVTPTPRAERLYPNFSQAVRLVEQAVGEETTFDPKTSQRRFRIAMTDIGEMVFLPTILYFLQSEAPEIAVDVCQIATSDLGRTLETGQIDFAIGNLPALQGATQSLATFEEHYVCMVRRRHPVIANALSVKTFLQARHIAVISPFSGHDVLEHALSKEGLQRYIVLGTAHFTSVPDIIARTDLVVTLPSRVATFFTATYPLRSFPLPISVPSYTVRIHWHERSSSDPGHAWMRRTVSALLAAL